MGFKNNVTRLLESRQIAYELHTYDHAAGVHSAVDVATSIGLPPERVYKTLVVQRPEPGQKPLLVMVPGPETLNLKRLAKSVGAKKLRMATHAEAEKVTGLQTGGISPLALINRGFAIYMDHRATVHATIAVSAGERGANISLAPDALIGLTGARLIDLGGA